LKPTGSPWPWALVWVAFTWVGTPLFLPSQNTTTQVRYPDPDIGTDSLPARKKAQIATANQFKVFYQFQFTDKVKESGITFVHRIVGDAGKTYKHRLRRVIEMVAAALAE
jgi:hypothetical protein